MFKYANEELEADTTSLGLAEPNQWFEGENSFFSKFSFFQKKGICPAISFSDKIPLTKTREHYEVAK